MDGFIDFLAQQVEILGIRHLWSIGQNHEHTFNVTTEIVENKLSWIVSSKKMNKRKYYNFEQLVAYIASVSARDYKEEEYIYSTIIGNYYKLQNRNNFYECLDRELKILGIGHLCSIGQIREGVVCITTEFEGNNLLWVICDVERGKKEDIKRYYNFEQVAANLANRTSQSFEEEALIYNYMMTNYNNYLSLNEENLTRKRKV